MSNSWDQSHLQGELHGYLALDWGDAVDLRLARQLLPTVEQTFPRRERTPQSIGYTTAPLIYQLPPRELDLPHLGRVMAATELAVFDFGGISLSWRIPFVLTPDQLHEITVACGRQAFNPDHARAATDTVRLAITPAIERPDFSPLSEDYLVVRIDPHSCPLGPDELLRSHGQWLSMLTRLETAPLSTDEQALILTSRIRYGLRDLFLPEWSAALLLDDNCDETLQTIEFTNLQLLEYRYIDRLLDNRLFEAGELIQPLARSWFPFWRGQHRRLRMLGELRVTAHSLFERTGNTLKLVGDQYLGRVYQLLAERFQLPQQGQAIERALDTVQSTYQVLSDQAGMFRAEFLEIVIILLILFEIVIGFLR